MAEVRDSLLDLERHRLLLEENVRKLRTALQHWRTWDAEYEALKEELQSASNAGSGDLQTVRDGFEGEIVVGKEIDEIFGPKCSKSKEQIINVLDRRIDYVSQNVASLQKQLEAAENKYAAATVLSQPDATDEEGQPFTEIIEELDENDNVISSRLNQPGQSLPHIRETLEKAGVHDLPPEVADTPINDEPPRPQARRRSQEEATKATQPSSPEPETKRSVSFAEDAEVAEEPSQPRLSRNAKRVQDIMQDARQQEVTDLKDAVVPADEDPEDAALRQQMLQYGMGQVGAVVAELDLDEGGSSDGYDYEYSDVESEDDEDQYGRTKSRVITDEYRKRMLELEERLGITSRSGPAAENVQREAEDEEHDDSETDMEGIGRIVVNHGSGAAKSQSSPEPLKSNIKDVAVGDVPLAKKGVRFAESLDIAPEDSIPSQPAPTANNVDPLSDIVERSAPSQSSDAAAPRKTSRFRRSRDVAAPSGPPKGPFDIPTRLLPQDHSGRPTEPPTGPEGTTMANKLVERDTVPDPGFPDELEENLMHNEVADEYQRLRRKFVQRQGGFLKEDESPIKPLDEDEGGERISRFKAARLSRR